jgi:hypothetical protein
MRVEPETHVRGKTMNDKTELLKRITIEEWKCGGRPCIRGKRMRVVDVRMKYRNRQSATLANTDPSGPALIWVRQGNCRKAAMLAAFDRVLPRCSGRSLHVPPTVAMIARDNPSTLLNLARLCFKQVAHGGSVHRHRPISPGPIDCRFVHRARIEQSHHQLP